MNIEDTVKVLRWIASNDEIVFNAEQANLAADQLEQLQAESERLKAEKLERENPKPLTLEELQNMNGEPVWVMHFDGSGARWGIVKSCDYGLGLCAVVDDGTDCCSAYWFSDVVGTIAYRHKPEHIGEATNMVEGE